MSEAVHSIMTQSWPWGSQIEGERLFHKSSTEGIVFFTSKFKGNGKAEWLDKWGRPIFLTNSKSLRQILCLTVCCKSQIIEETLWNWGKFDIWCICYQYIHNQMTSENYYSTFYQLTQVFSFLSSSWSMLVSLRNWFALQYCCGNVDRKIMTNSAE